MSRSLLMSLFDEAERRPLSVSELTSQVRGAIENRFASVFAQIEQELRSQYLITYTPTNRARDGSFRRLQIEITDPALRKQNLRLLYRQGYFAKQVDSSQ